VQVLSVARKAVAGVLAGRPEVLAGYIFGSLASGRARPNSDVDVAVLVSPAIMKRALSKYRLRLMADLGAALHTFDVDVVLLNTAPPALAQNVIKSGIVVSERSRADRVRFHVETLNRFLDTQPMRDLYLDRLKRRYARGGARG
jgi:predicted nucleotidyltransferase